MLAVYPGLSDLRIALNPVVNDRVLAVYPKLSDLRIAFNQVVNGLRSTVDPEPQSPCIMIDHNIRDLFFLPLEGLSELYKGLHGEIAKLDEYSQNNITFRGKGVTSLNLPSKNHTRWTVGKQNYELLHTYSSKERTCRLYAGATIFNIERTTCPYDGATILDGNPRKNSVFSYAPPLRPDYFFRCPPQVEPTQLHKDCSSGGGSYLVTFIDPHPGPKYDQNLALVFSQDLGKKKGPLRFKETTVDDLWRHEWPQCLYVDASTNEEYRGKLLYRDKKQRKPRQLAPVLGGSGAYAILKLDGGPYLVGTDNGANQPIIQG